MSSKKNRLITCAIVTDFHFNFRDDPRGKAKTKALNLCEYRSKSKESGNLRVALCSHPDTNKEDFLANFCPRANLFFATRVKS